MITINSNKNWYKYFILLTGIIISGIIGFLDFRSGAEISVSIFYLIPITLVAWYTNKTYGLVLSFFSASIWLIAEIYAGTKYSSDAIQFWNAAVRLGFFFTTVFLLSAFKRLQLGLENKVKKRTEELSKEIVERKNAEVSLKEKSEKLSQLAKKIQTVRDEENSKIARELHDELGQSLTAIKIELAWLSKKNSNNIKLTENLVSLTEIVEDTIKTVQKISSRLRPKLLDELGLFPAIERYLREYQSKTGIRCEFIFPENGVNINKQQSTSLYRIFQEAITNISRHANATSITVNICIEKNNILKMRIKDNGSGLTANWHERSNSLGILGMTERAEMAGGELYIKSELNNGTEVSAVIPISNKN
ncbi:MAG: sensor histidine kinase [Ignavibacteriae bacterium]|nr:MAG: sensor histidine kinase [Ignavibacteriota bacterium]